MNGGMRDGLRSLLRTLEPGWTSSPRRAHSRLVTEHQRSRLARNDGGAPGLRSPDGCSHSSNKEIARPGSRSQASPMWPTGYINRRSRAGASCPRRLATMAPRRIAGRRAHAPHRRSRHSSTIAWLVDAPDRLAFRLAPGGGSCRSLSPSLEIAIGSSVSTRTRHRRRFSSTSTTRPMSTPCVRNWWIFADGSRRTHAVLSATRFRWPTSSGGSRGGWPARHGDRG